MRSRLSNLYTIERLPTEPYDSLSPRKEEKQYGRQIHTFVLLKVLLY